MGLKLKKLLLNIFIGCFISAVGFGFLTCAYNLIFGIVTGRNCIAPGTILLAKLSGILFILTLTLNMVGFVFMLIADCGKE